MVNKNGVLKSLNKGKHKKLLSQLKKLKKFGSQQIFLLELYVIERGYLKINNFPPKDLIDEIDKKVELLKKSNFGYVMMVDEPAPNVNDEGGGINHIPINILPTKENKPRNPFLELTNHLNDFYEKYTKDKKSNFKGFPIITYCKKCKKLILFGTYDKSRCPNGEHIFY